MKLTSQNRLKLTHWGDKAVKVRQSNWSFALSVLAVITPYFLIKTYCYARTRRITQTLRR